MMNRKIHIENIINSLSLFQKNILLSNAANLYDNNILAEDFLCGLLNIIYGWELINVNNDQRNAPAIDLADDRNGIAIQVTASGSREKIEDTVDKFIEHKLYEKYNTLKILFLGDPPKYKKPIDTRGFFEFDKKRDLLSIKSLMQEIRKLDIEQLRRTEAYLQKELEEPEAGKSRRKRIAIAVVPAVLAIGFSALILFRHINLRSDMPYANVYFSKILPFDSAGYYASADEVSSVVRSDIETDMAFSILSFVRNYGDRNSVIEEVYCDILQLQPIEEAVIILDAEIIDDTWKLYAFNNGWGDAGSITVEEISVQWSYDEEKEPLDVIAADTYITEKQDVKSGKVLPLAEYKLDGEKYQVYSRDKGIEFAEITAEVRDGINSYSWQAYLTYTDGRFELGYGGMGDYEPQITLFAVLDVDSNPLRIFFTGPDSTPAVGDTLRIETVIAPTKSCEVECRNVFSVNGEFQQTDVWKVRVDVPVFQEGTVGLTGRLTKELAQMDGYDEYSADRILRKYLYDPESVRETYQISD